jgi:hypothetical protein
VHVQHALRPGAIVQVVNILGDQQQLAGPLRVEPGERVVRGIGFDLGEVRAAFVVEAVDQLGVVRERLWRAHILDAMPLPQSAGAAKGGDAGFGGNACAGEDDDVADFSHPRPHSPPAPAPAP